MTTIITRLYSTKEQAQEVVDKLVAEEFRAENVDLISKSGGGKKSAAADDLKAKIKSAGIYPTAASTYAEHLAGGDVLLVARAPVGQALLATKVIDSFPALDPIVKHPDYYRGTVENSTTVYRRAPMPGLLNSDQTIFTGRGLVSDSTPFSSMFGIPLLTSGKTAKSRLITKKTTWFSSIFGLGLLTHGDRKTKLITGSSTTWFSNIFHIPLLWSRK